MAQYNKKMNAANEHGKSVDLPSKTNLDFFLKIVTILSLFACILTCVIEGYHALEKYERNPLGTETSNVLNAGFEVPAVTICQQPDDEGFSGLNVDVLNSCGIER